VGFYCQTCYKDHLLRLIDEKQFKSELLAFPLGEETTDIKPEHRGDLMPVLLRLLYGRMRAAKAGKKHGGRGAIQGRRALIMHHMLALPEQEVRYFFNLVFEDLFTGSVGFGMQQQCSGSVTFWCGSGSVPLTNGSESGSCLYVSDLQDANRKIIFHDKFFFFTIPILLVPYICIILRR
jgi:hypothetical protein